MPESAPARPGLRDILDEGGAPDLGFLASDLVVAVARRGRLDTGAVRYD